MSTRVPADFAAARAEARSAYQDYIEHNQTCPRGCSRDLELHVRSMVARDRMNALRPAASRLAVGGAA